MKRKSSAASSVVIHIDGAAHGNPGPAGAGVVIQDSKGKSLKQISRYLGEATNNVAEWCAFIIALQESVAMNLSEVTIFTDSELLERQVIGRYKVKNKQLQWLQALSLNLLEKIKLDIQHVPREQNKVADKLAQKAVVGAQGGQLNLF